MDLLDVPTDDTKLCKEIQQRQEIHVELDRYLDWIVNFSHLEAEKALRISASKGKLEIRLLTEIYSTTISS